MSDITITLTLTPDEAERLKNYAERTAALIGDYNFLEKFTRAIERAESFVDNDDSGNELVICVTCEGTGKKLDWFTNQNVKCFDCSGTGKEYV